MATPERPRKQIETDEIADRLAGDQKEGLIRLTGRFLGNSDDAGHYRLYLTEQMDRYLEFQKAGTIEVERFPSGRLIVWLKSGTKVVEVASRPVSEEFLSGAIGSSKGSRPRGTVRTLMAAAGDGCGYSSLIPANCPNTSTDFTCNPRDPSPDCPFNN